MKLSRATSIKGKDVTALLRKTVYPLLKAEGFDDWTSRTAWRHRNGRIDVIEFRSFNDYNASVLECTTASLTIWLGTSLPGLRYRYVAKDGNRGPRPHECQMPIRGEIAPSIYYPKTTREKSIWVIDNEEDANCAALAINKQLEEYGLRWLNWQYELVEIDRLLTHSEGFPILEEVGSSKIYLDAGNGMCPSRHRMIAEVAVAMGDFGRAAENYEWARWTRHRETDKARLLYSEASEEDRELVALARAFRELTSAT